MLILQPRLNSKDCLRSLKNLNQTVDDPLKAKQFVGLQSLQLVIPVKNSFNQLLSEQVLVLGLFENFSNYRNEICWGKKYEYDLEKRQDEWQFLFRHHFYQ